MRVWLVTMCAVFTVFITSCGGTRDSALEESGVVLGPAEGTGTADHVAKESCPTKTTLCNLCSDKDFLITLLYVIILVFSYLYYKHTGKRHDTLEENLVVFSKKITWRHRILLFIAAWLHSKINNKKTQGNNDDYTK